MDNDMADEDTNSQRHAKAEERKDEVIKVQTLVQKRHRHLDKRQVIKRVRSEAHKPTGKTEDLIR
jgi:hypothetical protein